MGSNPIIGSITKFIFVEDRPQRADLIVVAGSGSTRVAKESLKLYKQGFANKIIFTGGFNEKLGKRESEFMADIAVRDGVDRKDIYLEKKSTNTKENAIESLRLVKASKLKHKIIIVVGKPYHALRLKMTFAKVFPKSKILVAPSKYDSLSKKNWWKTEWGRWRVFAEVEKIGKYYIKGDLEVL